MRSKNNLIRIASVLPGLAIVFNANAKSMVPSKPVKPNVLMIYTDDHRYTGIHALGKMQVKTPNIDALVNQGISFSNSFLMGAFSGATCMLSRAMSITGKQLFELKDRGYLLQYDDKGSVIRRPLAKTDAVGPIGNENTDLSFLPACQELLKSMQEGMKRAAIKLGDTKERAGINYDYWDFISSKEILKAIAGIRHVGRK